MWSTFPLKSGHRSAPPSPIRKPEPQETALTLHTVLKVFSAITRTWPGISTVRMIFRPRAVRQFDKSAAFFAIQPQSFAHPSVRPKTILAPQ
jgi:hypothetical protein